MKQLFKELWLYLIIIIFIFGVSIATDYFIGLQWYGFIEPKKENVRREIFMNTRSYNEGQIQNLIKYKYEYDIAKSNEEKQAIASMIRHAYAEFDEKKLSSSELYIFLKKIKYGELK